MEPRGMTTLKEPEEPLDGELGAVTVALAGGAFTPEMHPGPLKMVVTRGVPIEEME